MKQYYFNEEHCLLCGAVIPEDLQVCPNCMKAQEGCSSVEVSFDKQSSTYDDYLCVVLTIAIVVLHILKLII